MLDKRESGGELRKIQGFRKWGREVCDAGRLIPAGDAGMDPQREKERHPRWFRVPRARTRDPSDYHIMGGARSTGTEPAGGVIPQEGVKEQAWRDHEGRRSFDACSEGQSGDFLGKVGT